MERTVAEEVVLQGGEGRISWSSREQEGGRGERDWGKGLGKAGNNIEGREGEELTRGVMTMQL